MFQGEGVVTVFNSSSINLPTSLLVPILRQISLPLDFTYDPNSASGLFQLIITAELGSLSANSSIGESVFSTISDETGLSTLQFTGTVAQIHSILGSLLYARISSLTGGDTLHATLTDLADSSLVAQDSVFVELDLNDHALDGLLSTLVGGTSGFIDGQLHDAAMNQPRGLVLSNNSILYIADRENNALRYVSGQSLLTLAGDGAPGFLYVLTLILAFVFTCVIHLLL